MKDNGREIVKDMKFLIKELHKEWEKSGVTKAKVLIGADESEEIKKAVSKIIARYKEVEGEEDMTFKQSIYATKKNYILLRLARKIKEKEEKTKKRGADDEILVPVDMEEFDLLKAIYQQKFLK